MKRVKKIGFYSSLLVLIYILVEAFSFTAYSLVKKKFFVFSDMQSDRLSIIGSKPSVSTNTVGFVDLPQFSGGDYAMFIHPYLGYLHSPMELLDRSKNGFRDHDFPAKTNDYNRLNIAILGGSFAQGVLSSGTRAFFDKLYTYDLFAGKEIRLYPMATGGYKQPQQLFLLTFLLTLGAHFDIIINLDGFNEIALPPAENIPKKVFPFYPRNWYTLSQGLEIESLILLGKIAHVREKRKEVANIFSTAPLQYSITANVLWYCYDVILSKQRNNYEITFQEMPISGEETLGYHVTGPSFHYNDEPEMYHDLASYWKRCSVQIHEICKGNSIAYYHFLQPNQYIPGSKPMQEQEKQLAYVPDHLYKRSVELGYPYLIEEGKKLTEYGIQFCDLTMIFQDTSEPLYNDSCCHLNARGYSMIGAEMGNFIGRHYSNACSGEGSFDGTLFSDDDGDGLGSACDNCPQHPNTDQADKDQDGIGDACDPYDDTTALQDKDASNTGEDEQSLPVIPGDAKAFLNLGSTYAQEGRLNEAITEYKKALSLYPNYAMAHNNLGNAYLLQNELDEAVLEYNKALAIKANYANAHSNLATIHYSKGNYQLAILHCDKALELGVTNAELLELLKPYR